MSLRLPSFRAALLLMLLALPCAMPTLAQADVGGYAIHPWVGCSGGYNSGSWDDAGHVYVPCGSPSTIAVYDEDGSLVERIVTDRFVSDVAPTRDGTYLYLAGPQGPRRLVRDEQGAWVTDAWTPATYSLWGSSFAPGGQFVATDAAGNVYFADGAWAPNSTHTVIKYAPDGRLLTRFGEWAHTWQLGSFYWALGGLAVSNDGATIYTVELGNNRVQEWSLQPDGHYAVQRSIGGTEANNPDRSGSCDYAGWLGRFAAPYDVALDRAGNLYVINTTCKQVLKFSPGFANLLANVDVRIGDGNYPRPHGFAVGTDGTVYVGENQRMLRPNAGVLPADGMPPAQIPAPVPTPTTLDEPAPVAAAPAAALQAPMPAPATVEQGAVRPSAGPKPDAHAPRLWLVSAPTLVTSGGFAHVTLRARCSERCVVDLSIRSGPSRLVRRRVVIGSDVVTIRMVARRAALLSRRALVLDCAVRDRAGNSSRLVRRVTSRG